MDKPINVYVGHYANFTQSASPVIKQETVWRGERCIIYAPAASLLGSGSEEISFGMSEHAEQRKLTQAKQSLIMTRRKKREAIDKVKARQRINKQVDKRKNNTTNEQD